MHARICHFLTAIAIGLVIPAALSAAPMLSLTPQIIAGLPGTTDGWAFTITNDAGYIEITSAQFCAAPVSFPACTSPVTGVFTDFVSGFNDIIVGPPGGTLPAIVTQAFNLAGRTGIGSFEIGALSLLYTQDSGSIVLTYNLTDLDPNEVNAMFLGSGTMFANASVVVTDEVSSVPEPSSALLVAAALIGVRMRAGKR